MNDHETFHDLDARAATAAADLRAAASARSRPTFDPERSPSIPIPGTGASAGRRSVPRRTLAAVAAVLVLVAGGAVWVAARPHDDRQGPLTTTTDAPRPFVLGSVPKGFALAGAGEVTPAEWAAADGESAPLVIYGPAADQPELGLTVIEGFTADDLGEGIEPFEVDGVKAYALDDQGLGRHVVILAVEQRAVMAISPTLGRDDLVRLLEGVRVSARAVTLADGALPQGWDELGSEPSVIGLASAVAAGRGSVGPGSFVAYSAGDVTTTDSGPADSRLVLVSSTPGDEARLHAMELVASDSRSTTVRGHLAVVGTSSVEGGSVALPSAFVTWLERPGELIRLTAMGVPLDELVKLAESLEPIGGEAWNDLVDRSRLGDFDPGDTSSSDAKPVEMDRGRFDDGTAWVLRVHPGEGEGDDASGPKASIELRVALGGDSSSGSSGGSGTAVGSTDPAVVAALGASSTVEQGGRTFGAGFVGDDVASVSLRRADGSEVDTALLVVGAGRRAWLAEVADGVVEVVALAADGSELARLPFGLAEGGGGGSAPAPQSPTTVVTSGD